jgi:hypothetical protein
MRFEWPYYVSQLAWILKRPVIQYASSHLFWNLPHALHTAEQVAAPQHEPPRVISYSEAEQSVYRSCDDSSATYRANAGHRHQRQRQEGTHDEVQEIRSRPGNKQVLYPEGLRRSLQVKEWRCRRSPARLRHGPGHVC